MDLVIASKADINVYFHDINIAEADNLLFFGLQLVTRFIYLC